MKNIISSCILLLIFHQIYSEETLPDDSQYVINDCELGNGIVIGCSDDCKGRKFCMQDKIYNIDCLAQTGRSYCSPKTLDCVSISEGCDLPHKEFICPGVGYFPHPLNCTKFYDCKTGKIARLAQCNSLVFDPLNERCVSNLHCYTFSSVNGLCRGKLNTIVTHPLNKRLYVLCGTEMSLMGQCPEDLIFNALKLSCEYNCKSRGRFVDKENSQCYYECSTFLKPIHTCCNTGEVYNDQFGTCMPV